MGPVSNADWTSYEDPSGFKLQHPPGWRVWRHQSGAVVVDSPDSRAFVLIEELPKPLPGTEAEILEHGKFPASTILSQGHVGKIENQKPGMASCYVRFQFPGGGTAIALLTCEVFAKGAIVAACAAREPNGLGRMAPVLWQIKRSYNGDHIRDFAERMGSLIGAPNKQYDDLPKPTETSMFDEFLGQTKAWIAQSAGSLGVTTPPIPKLDDLLGQTKSWLSQSTAAISAHIQAAQKPPEGPRPPATPAPPPIPMPAASASAALTFVPFTEPQRGTFHIEVPRGWQVGGGFRHAGLGDRRMFVAVQSPDGITVSFGDPNCPQCFYHDYFQFQEQFITYPQGCAFLNLAPSPKKLAAYYLKKVAPARFGQMQIGSDRDRKDLVERGRRQAPQIASMEFQITETTFRAGARSGHCLASSLRDKNAFFGSSWIGNVVVWLTPPGRDAVGEEVAIRMIDTFQMTAQLNQIVQQDEAIIAANGAAGVMAQQQWFAGQQAAHFAQNQMGDVITGQYWSQQQANDRMMSGWEQRQNTYDDIFQRGSDAMLGNARLYDDGSGKEYQAPAGSNYYWIDSATGTVTGTETNQPPDYQRDYRLMKKL